MDFVLIGAVIVIVGGGIGAVGTWLQSNSSSKQSKMQTDKIDELDRKNTQLKSDLASLKKQNSKLHEELTNARQDVENARKEASNNIYGSKGAIFVKMNAAGTFTGGIFNEEDLPVYDASISVTRYDEILSCDKFKSEDGLLYLKADCYNKATRVYNCPIVYGNTVIDFSDFNIDKHKVVKLLIKFTVKRGTYYQQFISDPRLGFAHRVLEEEGEKEQWLKFLNGKNGDPVPNIKRRFKVVKVINTQLKEIDWDKEFPLPMPILLIK